MHQCAQRQRIQRHTEITCDAHQDQCHRIILFRQLRKNHRTAKCYHLRGKQKYNLPYRIQIQIRADIDTVIDDCSYTIDIQEKAIRKNRTFLSCSAIFFSVFKILPNAFLTACGSFST